jgi:hypothetical protein
MIRERLRREQAQPSPSRTHRHDGFRPRMTSAEFNDRYQLVRQVTEDGVRTFHAVASSGAVVMVHMLDASDLDGNRSIVGLLERLDPAEKPRIIEVTEVDGSPVIVTRFILEFSTLPGWLETHATGPAAAPPAATPRPAAGGPSSPGAVPPPAVAPPASGERPAFESPLPAPPAPAGRDGAREPSEFSLMFRAQRPDDLPPPAPSPGDAAQPADPPAAPSTPGPAVPEEDEAGEFTRMFRAASDPASGPAPPPAAPPPQAAAPPPPASGTSVPPLSSTAAPGAAEVADTASPLRADSPPAAGPTGPGEFTRLFQAPTVPAPPPRQPQTPPAEPSAAADADSFTAMFRSPAASTPPPSPPPHQAPPAGPPPGAPSARPAAPVESGEGEFTRMIRAATGLDRNAPPSSGAPSQPPSPLQPPPPVSPPLPPSSPPVRPVPGQPSAPAPPGEFTSWFAKQTGPSESDFRPGPVGGRPGQGSSGGPTIGPAADDYLSRLSGGGAKPAGPVPPAARAPDPWSPPQAGPPPMRSGPGEYTRIFSAPPPPGPGPLPPPPPAPPPAGPSRKWLIGGLIGIFVLALLFVALFALLGGQPAPADDAAPADSAVSAPAGGE